MDTLQLLKAVVAILQARLAGFNNKGLKPTIRIYSVGFMNV
jgi:hypothetical protein